MTCSSFFDHLPLYEKKTCFLLQQLFVNIQCNVKDLSIFTAFCVNTQQGTTFHAYARSSLSAVKNTLLKLLRAVKVGNESNAIFVRKEAPGLTEKRFHTVLNISVT